MEKQTAWNTFLAETDKMQHPARGVAILRTAEIEEIQACILEVIRVFLQKGLLHLGLKIYVDQKLSNKMVEQMQADPPRGDDTLRSWTARIFGKRKFGVVMNSLESYSNAFAEAAASITRPLVELAGLPAEGLSYLFFMGDYGFTPFGVHKEARGEEGFLFHLGPAVKQFYAWDDPALNQLSHNNLVFHDVPSMLPEATNYALQPGDVMFIPHQVYHVANTSSFSVSLVVDFINPPQDRFEQSLLTNAAREIFLPTENYVAPLVRNAPAGEWSQQLDFSSLQQKLVAAHRSRTLELISNGGIGSPSLMGNGVRWDRVDFSISGKKVFPIVLETMGNGKTIVFARGHRFTVSDHPALAEFIGRLNAGTHYSVAEILNYFQPDWEVTVVFGFLQDLIQVESVNHSFP